MTHNVFISYSSKDNLLADMVCEKLESNGVRCWIAPRDVPVGMDWNVAIMKSLSDSRVMVLIWTKHSNCSPLVALEVKHAFNKNISVIPFRVDDIAPSQDLEFYLTFVQWLDASSPSLEDHLQRLVIHVQAILGQSTKKTTNFARQDKHAVSEIQSAIERPANIPSRLTDNGTAVIFKPINEQSVRNSRLVIWVIGIVVALLLSISVYFIATRDLRATNVAVVRTSTGRLVWVNGDGSTSRLLSSNDHMPDFFIRGWAEDATAKALAENQKRLQVYREMLREFQLSKLSERVSEVNLLDLQDVRVQLAGEDSHIEVRLGNTNFGKRLINALKKLDEQRSQPRGPYITYLDATQDERVIIGFSGVMDKKSASGSGNSK